MMSMLPSQALFSALCSSNNWTKRVKDSSNTAAGSETLCILILPALFSTSPMIFPSSLQAKTVFECSQAMIFPIDLILLKAKDDQNGKAINIIIMKRTACPRTKNQSVHKANLTFPNPLTNPPKGVRTKSVQQLRKKHRSPAKKVQQKVFDLGEELLKCRERQMQLIKRNVSLLKYYNCLLTLFMVTYTSCQALASNFFQIQRRGSPLQESSSQLGTSLIGLLLKIYETAKNHQYETKIRRLAKNILKVSPTASDFQRKADFVSRKVVLNCEKTKEVELSFMCPALDSFWRRLMNMVVISTQVQFIEEMFELPPERLCLKDFQRLLEGYLCGQQFQEDLNHHTSLRNGDSSQHGFDVEFLLIEKLCTSEESQQPEYSKPKGKGFSCQIY